MTSPAGAANQGVLSYFVTEATEYVDRLDTLLASAGDEPPDPDAFGRYARALRGSATMSKQYGVADIAAGLERVARGVRNRVLQWTPAARQVAIGTVDDLRLLVRSVWSWGAAEDRRVDARRAELARLVPPPAAPRPTPPTSRSESGTSFLANGTSELARALDALIATPDDRTAIATAAERVHTLRGLADLRDMLPLPEVVDAVERTLKSLELGGAPASPTARQSTLLSAAAAVLRRAARDIATRGRPTAGMPELLAFNGALVAVGDESARADRIVPISQLFYDDAGPHIVSAAPQPPTTAAERFRMEVVSLAEHLRRVVAEARAQRAPEHREHHTREMRNALRALGNAASSFGEKQVARFAAEWSVRVATINDAQLTALDHAAALLANPATRAEDIARGLEQLAAPRATPAAGRVPVTVGSPTPEALSRLAPATRTPAPAPRAVSTAPMPPPAPAPRRPVSHTPTGRELRQFLQDGLAGLGALEEQPLSAPVPIPDEDIVPIEQLLYRGRAALHRAAELRNDLLAQGGPYPREAVQELFDLVDLALVE